MGMYLYSNPKDESEIVEVFQKMNDTHEYYKDGVKWMRIFTIPQASIDTKINCLSKRDFIEKTGKKKGTFGEMLDASKQASLERAKLIGKDPILESALAKRKGKSRNDSSEIVKMKDIKIEI